MKLQLLSDLHLEVHPGWTPQAAPGAELLVLAGDIGSYQEGTLLRDDDFGLARFSPLQGWPTPVLFVPGNHEYDTLDFDQAHARLRKTCERLGIIWLEREVITWAQILAQSLRPGAAPLAPPTLQTPKNPAVQALRFVGTTLWTDFDALGPLSAQPAALVGAHLKTSASTPSTSTLTQQLKARDKAFRAANYYLKKTASTRHGEPMLAEQVREQALLCQAWLTQALNEPFDGDTVVVTHFAPSLLSADPRYGMAPGTAGFCNALDPLLPKAKLWLHGHLHAPSQYVSQGCRVVANPLGYARKGEQAAFKPGLCLEI